MLVLVLASLCWAARAGGSCSAGQLGRVMAGVAGGGAVCRPRPTVVPLPHAIAGLPLLAPSHTVVDRCAGSCPHPAFSCLSTRTANLSLVVSVAGPGQGPGLQPALCTTAGLEQHTACYCGCAVGPGDCGTGQRFLHSECRCECEGREERAECLDRGWDWDTEHCRCLCPGRPYPPCPSTFVFDYAGSCACVPTQFSALPALQVALPLLLLGLLLGLTSLAQCRARSIGLFRGRGERSVAGRYAVLAGAEELELIPTSKPPGSQDAE